MSVIGEGRGGGVNDKGKKGEERKEGREEKDV